MGSRRALSFTVCLRDDDAKSFEFRTVADTAPIMTLVAAAVGSGRKVRAYILAADERARTREERYLCAKGYAAGAVKL